MNVKKLLARVRGDIWRLTDNNGIQTQNYSVRKRKLNRLGKLAKVLSCAVSTSLYSAFESMLLSCHVRLLEWIHTRYRTCFEKRSYNDHPRYNFSMIPMRFLKFYGLWIWIGTKKICTVNLLVRNKKTLSEPNSRWLLYYLILS